MTHPINIVSDLEIKHKIDEILFQLREEGIVRDERIVELNVNQLYDVINKLVRENITLARLNLSREKYIEDYNNRLLAINDAMNIIGGSFKIIKGILKKEYEVE